MTTHRLATYAINGSTRYGAVAGGGIVDLSARFGKGYPTLREVIAAGALARLAEDAEKHAPDHATTPSSTKLLERRLDPQ
jgi:hypothetical protein